MPRRRAILATRTLVKNPEKSRKIKLGISSVFWVVPEKSNEFYHLKSPLGLIQKKRFLKSEKNTKKIRKNPKKRFKKLDFPSFDLVIEAQKTDERNSKKGQYDSSHTFVQTAGNGVKAQMSYIGRGCSPLPGGAAGARASWVPWRILGNPGFPGCSWGALLSPRGTIPGLTQITHKNTRARVRACVCAVRRCVGARAPAP